jgi:hypothetical protein
MRVSDLHRRVLAQKSSLDPDAQAFLTATGITDATITDAINTLVKGLKSNNIWSKMKALYPFVGGTATTHKFNLKDPRDLDVAFRLQYFDAITHSSNGMNTVGGGYANTFFTPSANQSINSGHFGIYSRTQSAGQQFGGNGVRDATTFRGAQLIIRRNFTPSTAFFMWGEGANDGGTAGSILDARGFYLGSRTANNSLVYYKNALSILNITGNQTQSILSNNNYFLSAINENGNPITTTRDLREIAFSSIGDGLTSAEVLVYYNLVQAFQTTLGRQV